MELVEMTKSSPPKSVPQLFEELYETTFPAVAKFVSKMNGSFEDAKDIFQDALVIYYEKNQQPRFNLTISAEAYILGIAKHLWFRKFNRDHKNISLDESASSFFSDADETIKINNHKLLQLIESTGKKCLDLLRAFYYEKLPMRNIAQTFNYSSEHSATVQKYKCIEKIRTTIKTKSVSHEDFTE